MWWDHEVRAALVVALMVWVGSAAGVVAGGRTPGVSRLGKPNPKDETVELFAAIRSGKIQVRLIPHDSKRSRAFVENKTDRPINVRFPHAFAGVPVLAQLLDGPQRDPDRRPGREPQNIGGPMNNPFGQNPPGHNPMNPAGPQGLLQPPGGPGPLFNVKPEMVGQIKLTTVCLDYGKPNPRPRMRYAIRPIESVATDPAVCELCRLMGRADVDRAAAQAAAWHLGSGKTWEELARMKTSRRFPGDPVFSRKQIEEAKKLVKESRRLAQERKKPGPKKTALLGRR